MFLFSSSYLHLRRLPFALRVEDPFEDLNRFHKFNFEIIDPLMLEPLAKSYEELTPSFSKKVVNNFFSNLQDVPSAVNHLLQGKVLKSIDLATRF